jgi:hypothetical protein
MTKDWDFSEQSFGKCVRSRYGAHQLRGVRIATFGGWLFDRKAGL